MTSIQDVLLGGLNYLLLEANSSPYIDLIFTNQVNLSVKSGVHASLHPNCHHHIVHSSFNLNIYYPPPYQRLIWNYK